MTPISTGPESSEISERRNNMPQAGQATAIAPNKTVKIDSDGTVDHPNVKIPNGGIVEFKSETAHSWEVQFLDPDGADFYPLAIRVPANGSVDFVAKSQQDSDVCEYRVLPAFGATAPGKPNRIMGNNQIIIGGGADNPKRRK
jgi:hypothetical protein